MFRFSEVVNSSNMDYYLDNAHVDHVQCMDENVVRYSFLQHDRYRRFSLLRWPFDHLICIALCSFYSPCVVF